MLVVFLRLLLRCAPATLPLFCQFACRYHREGLRNIYALSLWPIQSGNVFFKRKYININIQNYHSNLNVGEMSLSRTLWAQRMDKFCNNIKLFVHIWTKTHVSYWVCVLGTSDCVSAQTAHANMHGMRELSSKLPPNEQTTRSKGKPRKQTKSTKFSMCRTRRLDRKSIIYDWLERTFIRPLDPLHSIRDWGKGPH